MVLMLGVLLWLASRNPLRTVAIVDGSLPGLCILAVTSLLSLWMTDIRSIYPAYFCGGDRKLLRRALAAGQDVVRRDTVALRPGLRQRKR